MYNKLPLPFAVGYSSADHQNWKQQFRNGDYSSFQLISPNDRFLPFQYKRNSVADTTVTVELWDAMQDGLLYNMDAYISNADFDIQTRGVLDYVTYFGQREFNLTFTLDCGIYYLKIYDDTNDPIYSEIFVVLEGTNTGTDYLAVNDDTYLTFDDNNLIIV